MAVSRARKPKDRKQTNQQKDRRLARALAVHAAPRSATRLREGWEGPKDYRFRLSRPGDEGALNDLVPLSGIAVEQQLADAVAEGVAGRLVLDSLDDPRGRTGALARLVQTPDFMLAAATVMMAVDRHDAPVGVCVSIAPGNVLSTINQAGLGQRACLSALLALVKVPALAVHPLHRGYGLGRVLLQQTARLQHGLGVVVVFGQFRSEEQLGPFYKKAGFTVLPPEEPLDLRFLADGVGGMQPLPGEQFFRSEAEGPLGKGVP